MKRRLPKLWNYLQSIELNGCPSIQLRSSTTPPTHPPPATLKIVTNLHNTFLHQAFPPLSFSIAYPHQIPAFPPLSRHCSHISSLCRSPGSTLRITQFPFSEAEPSFPLFWPSCLLFARQLLLIAAVLISIVINRPSENHKMFFWNLGKQLPNSTSLRQQTAAAVGKLPFGPYLDFLRVRCWSAHHHHAPISPHRTQTHCRLSSKFPPDRRARGEDVGRAGRGCGKVKYIKTSMLGVGHKFFDDEVLAGFRHALSHRTAAEFGCEAGEVFVEFVEAVHVAAALQHFPAQTHRLLHHCCPQLALRRRHQFPGVSLHDGPEEGEVLGEFGEFGGRLGSLEDPEDHVQHLLVEAAGLHEAVPEMERQGGEARRCVAVLEVDELLDEGDEVLLEVVENGFAARGSRSFMLQQRIQLVLQRVAAGLLLLPADGLVVLLAVDQHFLVEELVDRALAPSRPLLAPHSAQIHSLRLLHENIALDLHAG